MFADFEFADRQKRLPVFAPEPMPRRDADGFRRDIAVTLVGWAEQREPRRFVFRIAVVSPSKPRRESAGGNPVDRERRRIG